MMADRNSCNMSSKVEPLTLASNVKVVHDSGTGPTECGNNMVMVHEAFVSKRVDSIDVDGLHGTLASNDRKHGRDKFVDNMTCSMSTYIFLIEKCHLY